ncbi:MAG: deoxyribonuclease IV [Desulfobacteraceae bacterium]|nr:deoxyribonuclease IV [Desulfobacteraceae bacterium]
MPLLGAHMSIAGGLHLSFDRLKIIRGKAMQVFTTNQRQWHSSVPALEIVDLFHRKWEECGRLPVASHAIYLLNLALEEGEILAKSLDAFTTELIRSEALGIPYVIMHPGAHMGQGLEPGLGNLTANLDRAIESSRTQNVAVLIETTAGQGSSLGSSFEEIAFILGTSRNPDRLGVCYDTCHAFAAGYDIRKKEDYESTMSRLDAIVGLDRVKFFHLNDSKRELGSRVDRHEHIGKGAIGLDGFRHLLNDPRFRNHPMVLETPKGKEMKEDKINLRVLRSLVGKKPSGRT